MNHYINYQMIHNILLNKSEGEGNACFFSNLNKNVTKYVEIIHIILYIVEIHKNILSVYNQ